LLTKLQKRYIIAIVGYTVSVFIWRVNESFGNIFRTNFILSTTTFLLIYVPFEIYFSFRDIWFERWESINDSKVKKIDVKINLENYPLEQYLGAQIISLKEPTEIKSKNTIIVISHGFSDTIEKYQYLYIPLVLNGYDIITYDSRGIGRSKAAGKRYEFEKRIQDFKKVISWIKNTPSYGNKKIYAIGFSIGAMVTLNGGFSNPEIQKIIAISSISSYKKSIKSMNPYVLFIYLLKKVPIFISDEKAKKFSPYYTFYETKENLSDSEWKKLKNRVMLVHSKNDKITPFENFRLNCQILGCNKTNQLIFKKGGHSLKKNEIELTGAILGFFENNG
jgi:pimeloyl-ACP methyl ester carboxylesterase